MGAHPRLTSSSPNGISTVFALPTFETSLAITVLSFSSFARGTFGQFLIRTWTGEPSRDQSAMRVLRRSQAAATIGSQRCGAAGTHHIIQRVLLLRIERTILKGAKVRCRLAHRVRPGRECAEPAHRYLSLTRSRRGIHRAAREAAEV